MRIIPFCNNTGGGRGSQVIFENGAQILITAIGRKISVQHFTRHGMPGRALLTQPYPRKEDAWKTDQWPEVKAWEVEVTKYEPTTFDVMEAAEASMQEYISTLVEGMFTPASAWTGRK